MEGKPVSHLAMIKFLSENSYLKNMFSTKDFHEKGLNSPEFDKILKLQDIYVKVQWVVKNIERYLYVCSFLSDLQPNLAKFSSR